MKRNGKAAKQYLIVSGLRPERAVGRSMIYITRSKNTHFCPCVYSEPKMKDLK